MLGLQVYAVADDSRPICDLTRIDFGPIPMLQQSSFAFPLSNASLAKLNFKWLVQDTNGITDTSGLYQVNLDGYRQNHDMICSSNCFTCCPPSPSSSHIPSHVQPDNNRIVCSHLLRWLVVMGKEKAARTDASAN